MARVFREAAFVTLSLLFVAFAFTFPFYLFVFLLHSLFPLLEYLLPSMGLGILWVLGRGVDNLERNTRSQDVQGGESRAGGLLTGGGRLVFIFRLGVLGLE